MRQITVNDSRPREREICDDQRVANSVLIVAATAQRDAKHRRVPQIDAQHQMLDVE